MGNIKAVEEARMGANEHPIVFKTATCTLALYEQNVVATVNTATDSYTLYLPFVADAQGMTFSVTAIVANSKVLTLADQDDSEDWSDLTLDADEDAVVLYSTGTRWTVIENAIA